ncbi:isopenicillin N synthase family dioxygenase [Rhodotorula paludigena]|uniref:isopenicillin N synthase family dioxygenase n=1 Tax=Rhodotorula paludigena TaxID=86838 RepID=UPI00317539AC
MSVLSTGLGQRLVSASTEAAAFTELPVISLARLNGSAEDRKALAAEIQEACISSGFFYISDHGVPQQVIDDAFGQAKKFFAQPMDKKMLVDLHKGTSFKGYAGLKGENVDPANRGDVHEAWDMGDDSQLMKEGAGSGNLWPPAEDLPDFRPTLQHAWDEIMALGKRLLPIFSLALGLDEHYFDEKTRNPGSVMRILHYPPQFGPVDLREIGIGAHTDYEIITLLLQHGDVQALQVLNSQGEWVQAPPKPGTFVLNLGDMMQRISNGLFKSTVHRAINRTGQDRMSLPFFFGLDYDALVEVLPTCVTAERPPAYEPIKAGDYVQQRLSETYVKAPPTESATAPAV